MHGLGYGRGFDYEDHSVLGDETYSPLIANRTLDITRMFVDAGTLSIEDIHSKLGYPNLFNQLKNSNNYNRILKQINRGFSTNMSSYKYEISSLKNELIKEKEKKEKDNEITEIIVTISEIEGINCKIVFKDDMLKLIIHSFEEDSWFEFYEMFLKMKKEEWIKLEKRLIPVNIHEITNFEILRKMNLLKKDMIDTLIELDLQKYGYNNSDVDTTDVFYTDIS
jgi:hypothetical protein